MVDELAAPLNARPKRERLLAMAREAGKLSDPAGRRFATLAIIRLAVTPDVAPGPDGHPVLCLDAIPDIGRDVLSEVYGDPAGAEFWNRWLDVGEPEHWADLLGAWRAVEMMTKVGAGFSPAGAEIQRINLYGAQAARFRDILAKFDGATLRDRVQAIRAHPEKRTFLPESLCEAVWPSSAKKEDVTHVSEAELLRFLKENASTEKTKPQLQELAKKHFATVGNRDRDSLRMRLQRAGFEQKARSG
jgi:hypothetical protein